MRIWLIGAGRIGTTVLQQLQKNPDITVVVSDSSSSPQAVQDGVDRRRHLVGARLPRFRIFPGPRREVDPLEPEARRRTEPFALGRVDLR